MAPSLPQELIELIVEEYALQNDGKPGPLRFVSRSFYLPSRRPFFRTFRVTLTTMEDKAPVAHSRIDRLWLLLSRDSGVTGFVKNIQIHIEAGTRYRRPLPDRERVVSKLHATLQLLSKTPIESIDLTASTPWFSKFSLDNLEGGCPYPYGVIEELIKIRLLPSFRHLTLRRLAQVPHLLVTGVPSRDNLLTLDLQCVDMRGLADRSESPIYPSAQGRLCQSLPTQSILSLLSSNPPFSRLRTLAIDEPDKMAYLFQPLVVQSPSIDARWIWEPTLPVPPIKLPNLVSLTLRYRDTTGAETVTLARILNNCPSLEELILEEVTCQARHSRRWPLYFSFIEPLPRLQSLCLRGEYCGPLETADAMFTVLSMPFIAETTFHHLSLEFGWTTTDTSTAEQMTEDVLGAFDLRSWDDPPMPRLAQKIGEMTSIRSFKAVFNLRMPGTQKQPGCQGLLRECAAIASAFGDRVYKEFAPLIECTVKDGLKIDFSMSVPAELCYCTACPDRMNYIYQLF